MKKLELKKLIIKCLLEETEMINEAKTYEVLSDDIIGNELYAIGNALKDFSDRMSSGNDYKGQIPNFIKTLQKIEKTKKSFPFGEAPNIKGYGGSYKGKK